MSMKKQGKSKANENPVAKQQNPVNFQSVNQAVKSGINQPHNAKKEGLGPNTDR